MTDTLVKEAPEAPDTPKKGGTSPKRVAVIILLTVMAYGDVILLINVARWGWR